MVKFSARTRRLVATSSDGGPSIAVWLERIRAIQDDRLTDAIDAIWCGREGRETIDLPDTKSMLCVGWYHGRVEYCYLS